MDNELTVDQKILIMDMAVKNFSHCKDTQKEGFNVILKYEEMVKAIIK